MNQDLLFYIKEQLRAGASRDAIRSVLVDRGGWQASDIDELFTFIANPGGQSTSIPVQSSPAPMMQSPVDAMKSAPSVSPWGTPTPAVMQPAAPVQAPKPAPMQTPQYAPQNYGGYVQNQVTPPAPAFAPAPISTPAVQPTRATDGIQPISQYQAVARTPMTPSSPAVYGPTHAGDIPHFVGMPNEKTVRANGIQPQRGSGFFKIFFITILVLGILGGGLYAYTTYVNPALLGSPLTMSLQKFSELSSYRYNATIDATTTLTAEGRTNLRSAGVIFPPDFSETMSVPLRGSIAGAVSQTTNGNVVTNTYAIATGDASAVRFSLNADTVVNDAGLYVQTNDVVGAEELKKGLSGDDPQWLSVVPGTTLPTSLVSKTMTTLNVLTRSPAVITALIRAGAITATTELPQGDDAGTPVRVFQFTFVPEKVDAALAGLTAQSLPDHAITLLKSMTMTDGELWIGSRDLLPRKVSFKIRLDAPSDGVTMIGATVAITLSDYNVVIPAPTLTKTQTFTRYQETVSLIERDTQVKNTLSTARAVAGSYYNKKKSYLGFCTANDDLGAKSLMVPLEGFLGAGTVYCASTAKGFVMSAPISNNQYFCVDNTGSALARDTVPTTSCKI